MESLEEYNSDKSVLRLTTDRVPLTGQLQKEIALPLGVIVKPYGEPITVFSLLMINLSFRARRFNQSSMVRKA
jgi:hypothetical protein